MMSFDFRAALAPGLNLSIADRKPSTLVTAVPFSERMTSPDLSSASTSVPDDQQLRQRRNWNVVGFVRQIDAGRQQCIRLQVLQ